LQHVSVLLVLGGGGGIASPELACATRVLREYQVDARSFDTLAEVAAVMQGEYCLKSDRSYVCLVHEDQYDATTADALAASTGENVTLVTVGKQFTQGRTSHHIRSLEQMMPCALVKTILAMSEGKRHKVESVASPARSVAVHEGMDRLRILLAEDNLVNIKVMLRMLHRIGVKHVDVARNGEEAVAAESAKVYDVILMDMSMPIMDGLGAARLIGARRRDNERRKVENNDSLTPPPLPRIVFVTAHVSADFEEQCRQAGGCGFLPKPFKVDEIETLMRRICEEVENEPER
jgi:CheY-like chemotaxis protein